jgi:CheY-like chemotaxis protein
VDDDVDARLITQQILEPLGARVLVASDGPEALRLVDRVIPDVILCDLLMPDMDGFEVARRLRRDPRTARLPIIAVTALDRDPDYYRTWEAGLRWPPEQAGRLRRAGLDRPHAHPPAPGSARGRLVGRGLGRRHPPGAPRPAGLPPSLTGFDGHPGPLPPGGRIRGFSLGCGPECEMQPSSRSLAGQGG